MKALMYSLDVPTDIIQFTSGKRQFVDERVKCCKLQCVITRQNEKGRMKSQTFMQIFLRSHFLCVKFPNNGSFD